MKVFVDRFNVNDDSTYNVTATVNNTVRAFQKKHASSDKFGQWCKDNKLSYYRYRKAITNSWHEVTVYVELTEKQLVECRLRFSNETVKVIDEI